MLEKLDVQLSSAAIHILKGGKVIFFPSFLVQFLHAAKCRGQNPMKSHPSSKEKTV